MRPLLVARCTGLTLTSLLCLLILLGGARAGATISGVSVRGVGSKLSLGAFVDIAGSDFGSTDNVTHVAYGPGGNAAKYGPVSCVHARE